MLAAAGTQQRGERPWRGFTIVEVMIASAILGLGAAAVLSCYSTVTVLVEHQRRLSEAVNVCSSRMEQLLALRSKAPEILPDTTQSARVFDGLSRDGSALASHYRYTVYTTVTKRPGITGFIDINVRAEWDEQLGHKTLTFLASREE